MNKYTAIIRTDIRPFGVFLELQCLNCPGHVRKKKVLSSLASDVTSAILHFRFETETPGTFLITRTLIILGSIMIKLQSHKQFQRAEEIKTKVMEP